MSNFNAQSSEHFSRVAENIVNSVNCPVDIISPVCILIGGAFFYAALRFIYINRHGEIKELFSGILFKTLARIVWAPIVLFLPALIGIGKTFPNIPTPYTVVFTFLLFSASSLLVFFSL